MVSQLLWAFGLSVVIVALSLWRGSLSRSGAAVALVVGTLTVGLGGWVWGVLLGLFFVTSSLLSHYREREKQAAAEKFDKGHRRDWGQVLANGGLGTAAAILSFVTGSPLWFPFFLGVMATVNADTWATELGTLAARPPRLITTGRPVEAGTSGAISPLGTLVSLLGGSLIGLAAGLLSRDVSWWLAALMGAAGGLSGSLFDSLLGATVQRICYCDTCEKDTERRIHQHCGQPTRPLRGWPWLNNDLVNLLSSAIGGLVGVMLWLILR